jgi:hypothetical protein
MVRPHVKVSINPVRGIKRGEVEPVIVSSDAINELYAPMGDPQ